MPGQLQRPFVGLPKMQNTVFRIREYTLNRSLTRTVTNEAGNIAVEIQPALHFFNKCSSFAETDP